VKALRAAALVAVIALALWPEFSRYAAERRVGFATAAFKSLLDGTSDSRVRAELLALGEMAAREGSRLPGDPRPWILCGSAYLVNGQPQRAVEYYREAMGTGERAEIDLNLGRAYTLMSRKPSADAAFVRAGWISPEILSSLSPSVADPVREEISKYAHAMAEGRLTEPPPLPEEERR
jgi:cytochrome c-type biogenesis protein CcmH/NrfG